MKAIFKYTGIILSMFLLSCSAGKGVSKNEAFNIGNNTYKIVLPKENYKKQVIDNGGESIEIRFIFSDSISLFFTDNKSSTELVSKFLKPNDYLKFIDNDYLKFEFSENESLFFLEKRGDLFMGYANVPKVNKQKFDHILSTVQRK